MGRFMGVIMGIIMGSPARTGLLGDLMGWIVGRIMGVENIHAYGKTAATGIRRGASRFVSTLPTQAAFR